MSDSAGARFERLVQVMHTLRAPGGCPWDREQTLQTLRPFVLEETCELLDAIDAGDLDGIREELGDVVFEAVFVAELCAEAGHFSIADSVAAVTDKLIRRHPHIFDASGQPHGDTGGIDARGVKAQWDDIKDEERQLAGKAKKTMLSGIPRALPALLRAETMARKVATVGFDWPNALEALDKVEEEIRELREALATGNTRAPEIEEELGDLFFALANVARKLDLSPEAALRKANDKFQVRWEAMEAEARSENRPLAGRSLNELNQLWDRAKTTTRHDGNTTRTTHEGHQGLTKPRRHEGARRARRAPRVNETAKARRGTKGAKGTKG